MKKNQPSQRRSRSTEELQAARSEDAVRSSEERLRRMISVDGVGVVIFNESGKLIDSNDAFLEMCGYRREEVASGTLLWRVNVRGHG